MLMARVLALRFRVRLAHNWVYCTFMPLSQGVFFYLFTGIQHVETFISNDRFSVQLKVAHFHLFLSVDLKNKESFLVNIIINGIIL